MSCHAPGNCYKCVILRGLGEKMRKFKGRPRHSVPVGLFLAAAGASLLLTALAPRANADPTDYSDFEDPLGSRPRPAPELFSQPQGVVIDQPLPSSYNASLASNVASPNQSGGFQPFQVDANFSWTGATNSIWSNPTNWSPSGPPTGEDTAVFNSAFSNQPNLITATVVGTLLMTDSVAQNVTLGSIGAQILTIDGHGITGTGVLINNTSAFTLTITARIGLDASQTWTNNSGNLFTVSGATLSLGEDNVLTVNGTGNTLISAFTDGAGGMGSGIIKDGSGTLTITGNNSYSGGTTVNSGTLLVNGRGDLGDGNITVNNSGTLGGDSTSPIISRGVFGNGNTHLTVAAGGNLAPGNGGNNTAVITVNALTLEPASNFRIDINGTIPGIGYDRLVVTASGNGRFVITNSNLVVTVGTTLSVGQAFLIGVRTSAGPITGQFAQGNTVTGSDGTVFLINYNGGPDANDIVLTVIQAAPVPEPSTWIGGALTIAGLAFTQRQRRRLRKVSIRRSMFR